MVTVAQLVEPWTVTPVVVGSKPIGHPNFAIKNKCLDSNVPRLFWTLQQSLFNFVLTE